MFSTIPTSIPKIVPIKRIILFDSVISPPKKYLSNFSYLVTLYIAYLSLLKKSFGPSFPLKPLWLPPPLPKGFPGR